MCYGYLGLVNTTNSIHVEMLTFPRQISALLGRPMIIDRAECDVGIPSLALEGTQHSPLTHMKMQSSLIKTLFGRFGLTRNVTDPKDVQEYQGIVKAWIRDFPPPFDVNNPDKSLDGNCPWIVLHRHYIRTMAFSMILDPIRAYLARAFTIDAKEAELKIRSDGIDYCLELMVSLRGFFDHVYPRDSKFHFVLFCIFDTSTVLCSAILHDEHHTLPRRDDVFGAIDDAHAMLQRLRMVTKSARTSYGILSRIVQRLPRTKVLPGKEQTRQNSNAKRLRVTKAEVPAAPEAEVPGFVQSQVLAVVSPPTTASHDVLQPYTSIAINAPETCSAGSSNEQTREASPKPVSSAAVIPHSLVSDTSSVLGISSNPDPLQRFDAPSYLESQPQFIPFADEILQPVAPTAESSEGLFDNISEEDLGELATMWHFESLDFDFLDRTPQM